MSDDLISRQALKQAIYHEAFEADTEMQKWDGGCWIRYKLFEKIVDILPSVQPEQKIGRWIEQTDTQNDVEKRVEKFGKEHLIYNWIKCSDKLPENGEPVIVAVYGSDILMVNDNSIESLKKAIEKSRKIVRYTTLAYYINGDGWYSDGFPMMVTPEYWMLLPEPPEEEEK